MMNTRRLAWHGISFDVPLNWEIAGYRERRGEGWRLDIEDEYAVRLVVEWVRVDRGAKTARFASQMGRLGRDLATRAQMTYDISGLGQGWKATRYEFRETIPTNRKDRKLSVVPHSQVIATYIPPPGNTLICLTFSFLPSDTEVPDAVARAVTKAFMTHEGTTVPWEAFDVSFTLPAGFLIEGLSFDIGAKYLAFRWQKRRYHLWILSCADRFLKPGQDPSEWAVGYINAQRRVPGIVFSLAGPNTISWQRRWRSRICHRDELSRWCFRYRVGCELDAARNQLRIAVLNYRNEEDLRQLPPLPGLSL